MAFTLDPFLAYLAPPEMPTSTRPLSEEDLAKRQERLQRLGMDDGLLGRANATAMKGAQARSGLKTSAKESLMQSGTWAATM